MLELELIISSSHREDYTKVHKLHEGYPNTIIHKIKTIGVALWFGCFSSGYFYDEKQTE